MIEEHCDLNEGYHPFIIKGGWQLAKLNYTAAQHIENIHQLDVHLETDELFVAIKGRAVLIAAEIIDNTPHFEVITMKINEIYNIPKNVWHNIAMEKGSEVLIAEKANTHISDFKHWPLQENQRKALHQMVKAKYEIANMFE